MEVLGVALAQLTGDVLWRALVGEGSLRRHRAGDVLLRQGDPGTHVLAVVEGVVKVERTERDGRRRVLAFRGASDVVGEAAVLEDGEARLASVSAISGCTVSVITKNRFTRFVDEHGLSTTLTRHALTRLREADRARACYGGSRERMAEALLALAAAAGDSVPELAVTREDLALYLGVSRNTVSVRLREIGSGIVSAERKSIVIHDPAGLRAVASGHDR
ncbi:Crp/Fnr family transcriptional regulator [Streptomyces morookaense]|uniref:Crp/Fnr family transcriptional regulator n=1 Tax=Streptomyces morookaense TaxID=1970 RepID=A0A7Y7B159_STRMO|nr:Crp/Fnr family transcriptional regulator [Streptomyces morookaense]NVK77007.1 Crp/Fnr family transcriptional regulator [Streptomyces morookaense]GHF23308.1 Crp/Fnr family transcriptional regulator [Streptomyces morookaense]